MNSRKVPPTYPKILRGDGSITPTMALKIGALCGNGPNLWLNMQANHDLWFEARNLKREIASIEKAARVYG